MISVPERLPRVAASWGEVMDKIAILEIKVERLRAPEAVANARRELSLLLETVAALGRTPEELDRLRAELARVNCELWEIEDGLRLKEAAGSFDERFIELARGVYRTNDERSRIKRAISDLLGSAIVEEKQYPPY